MRRRRIVVVGDPSPLRASCTAMLRTRRDVTVVDAPDDPADFEALTRTVLGAHVDAVVDTGLVCWGRRPEAGVIGTMRLAAAVAHPDAAVRTVAAASSAAAYSASSRAPLFRREAEHVQPATGTLAAQLVEAEQYLRSMAMANPHIAVSILRLADLAGPPPSRGPLAELLGAGLVPMLAGFDPLIQLLHVDDAAAALQHAVVGGLAGIYNVAAHPPLRWSDAIRRAGATVARLPPLGPWTGAWARARGFAPIAPDTADVLRFGRCIDVTLIAGTGFQPRHTTADCVAAIV